VADYGVLSRDPYDGEQPEATPEPEPSPAVESTPTPPAAAREPLGFWQHAWATAFGVALSVPILIAGAVVVLVLLDALIDDETTNSATATWVTPAVTSAAPQADIEVLDSYWSSDGDTYYVEVGGVESVNYCEVHLTNDGRRTGDWGNELWDGRRSEVTVAVHFIQHDADSFRVECG